MRPFNPELIRRLNLEAEAIETACLGFIHQETLRISDKIANWRPAPFPETNENQGEQS